MIKTVVEKLITRVSPDGSRTFFETDAFPWAASLEREWRSIRGELDELLEHREAIPNFQDLSKEQAVLTEGDQWKTFFFYAYGHKIERNCARCPETTRLLAKIPGMKTAMFSPIFA